MERKVIDQLRAGFRGDILLPEDPGYDDARKIWNAMIDRKPAMIAQCTQADDIPPVMFGRPHGKRACR